VLTPLLQMADKLDGRVNNRLACFWQIVRAGRRIRMTTVGADAALALGGADARFSHAVGSGGHGAGNVECETFHIGAVRSA